ncbi:hypothetical protein HGB07_08000, partial [Candidatus Roizmanbacteria bacterium]|nr:hypothetical protein [Candidatus Roizmanbacteria bacterium]
NCPYDEHFRPLLRPLLFTVLRADLNPRMAAERLNSGETRFSKIVELVRESKFAIHDLSRIKAKRAGEYFRLNMPFELGLDVGCSCFGAGEQLSKRCLILAKEPYRHQIALSDLSNSDIASHQEKPVRVVAAVRHWIVNDIGIDLPGPSALFDQFTQFMADNYDELLAHGFDKDEIPDLPVPELIRYMREWVATNIS